MKKRGRFLTLCTVGLLAIGGCYFLWHAYRDRQDQRMADRGIDECVRAVLKGDYAAMERYQFGDELERLGVQRAAFEKYRQALLEGYLAPNAEVKVSRKTISLPPARNDYEENMNRSIQDRLRTNLAYNVEVTRSDGKPPIAFTMNAVRGADGWVISPTATLIWFQVSYSEDPKLTLRRVIQAMDKASIEGICSPNGSWLRRQRIQEYLDGKIAYIDVYNG